MRVLQSIAFLHFLVSAVAQNVGCITTVDANKDYFPDKVVVEFSKYWSVSYFKTYKIVRNLDTLTSYLLYLCGTKAPASEANKHTHVIEIPLKGEIGITETPMITYLKQLNSLDDITAYLSDPKYVSSKCFLEKIKAGEVAVIGGGVQDPSGGGGVAGDIVAFTSPFSTVSFTKVVVSEYKETTNQATFEWLKFYSTFFNKEKLANQVTQAAEDRWTCVAEEAGLAVADGVKPVVLWAYYSDYCGGWVSVLLFLDTRHVAVYTALTRFFFFSRMLACAPTFIAS
jgi:catabolite regulation protein CreA